VLPQKIKSDVQKPTKVENQLLDHKISRKIINMARSQQDEIKSESVNPGLVINNQDSDDDENALVEDEDDYDEDFVGEWMDDTQIDAKDEKLLEKFMGEGRKKVSLAELIKPEPEQPQIPSMNPKVIEVYSKVGVLLSRYKSGPLPKTFKIVPTLRDWEQVNLLVNGRFYILPTRKAGLLRPCSKPLGYLRLI
jgi:essential nuclear protein 1